MVFLQKKRNQLEQLFQLEDFSKLGLRAEYSGEKVVKISKNGRPIGQIRKSIGKFVLYSAETGEVLFQAFSPQKVLAALAQRL